MSNKWEVIIKRIAKRNHTTPARVREEMIAAMKEGENSQDPLVRARWAAIPRKGTALTLEEFLDYLSQVSSGIS